MRHTLLALALLALAPDALEAQRRRLAPPGHRLTIVVSDVSDRPCTGLELPASGVAVDVSAPRIHETAVTGRDGRAIFHLPTGSYDIVFSKGSWSKTVEGYPLTADAMAATAIPQRTPATTWDLAVELAPTLRVMDGDPFEIRARVQRTDPDDLTYVPAGTIELQRSSSPILRRRGVETVHTWNVPPLCAPESDWLVFDEPGLSAGQYTYLARLQQSDRNNRNNSAKLDMVVATPLQPDLALSVEPSHPTTIGPGETMTYTVRVANSGTGPASGVVVRSTVSADLDFLSADGSHDLACSPGGTNALGQVVVCSGGQIGARRTAEITIRASLPETAQPGHTIQFVSRADPDEAIDEIDEGNNHQVVQATSGSPPPPDLAVSIEQSREVLPAGKSIRYRVSIANEGGTTASGIYVRSRISPNLDFVYAHGSDQLTCSPGATNAAGLAVECTGGVAEPGRSALIEIVGELPATANAGHELRFVAWADPDDAIEESDEGNNHRTVIATTGDPVLVEHVVDGPEFALAAHEAGWSSQASKVEGPPMGLCNMDEEGYAGLTNTPLGPEFLVCDYSYFASTGGSLRLAAPWTLVSIDVNFSPRFSSRPRSWTRTWTSAPQSGSDNIFFSFRLIAMVRLNLEDAAGIDRVILLGPEGKDWRDALE